MSARKEILCIIGTTASGKSARAVSEAQTLGGEVISVDSRQVYKTLDIGTEKITTEEMCGIPHHLIDIRDPKETYSAGDFIHDTSILIKEIQNRGNVPILAGGTHFYFHAFFNGLPNSVPINKILRDELEQYQTEELYGRVCISDPRRANNLDPKNRRRIIRALEIIATIGIVPTIEEVHTNTNETDFKAKWIVLNTSTDNLRERIDTRLKNAFDRGLIEEVKNVRACVGDKRLNELGLEYRTIGEFLRGERNEESLIPALSAKLWQYARRQKAWLRKLTLTL